MTNEEHYKLKEAFLQEWPLSRIKQLTLEEYTNLDKTSFCYWLEAKTYNLGSFWGGSSYKFGIYKKRNLQTVVTKEQYQDDGEYAWSKKYGNTKDEVFQKIKNLIISVIENIQRDALEEIDSIDLGDAYKWKIAFLYSNYNVINIFKRESLLIAAQSLGYIRNGKNYSELNRFLLSKKIKEQDYFDYTSELWRTSLMNIEFKEIIDNFKEYLENAESKIGSFTLNDNRKGENYIWISDNENVIGGDGFCHYELITRKKDRKIWVEIHFEHKKASEKLFKPLLEDKISSNFIWNSKHIREELSIAYYEPIAFNDFEINQKLEAALLQLDETFGDLIRNTINHSESQNLKSVRKSLNQILYGPPGTGKTFNTINKALEIIDDEEVKNLDFNNRKDVKTLFDKKLKKGQIVFTTFHQSMSYEDFIEGIKPVLADEEEGNDKHEKDSVEYEIKDGILKELANRAKGLSGKLNVDSSIDFRNKDYYKMSLGGKNRPEKHNWSIDNNLIFLGWGGDKDFTSMLSIKTWKEFRNSFIEKFPELVEESKYVIQAVYIFQKMKIGDVVIISKGNHIIDAIGVIESEYFYDETKDIENYQFRKVKWLATNLNASPELFVDKAISQQTIYQFYNQDIKLESFESFFKDKKFAESIKNYVLIIDEINRGNVSQIFGELITLIEESKRLGNDEALEVTLPYSKETFGVPPNLYIIGTMNTADRSVEALDTALRRRFSFEEMMPDEQVILDKNFTDYDRATIMHKINQRVEVLLDRNYMLGHSYFIKEDFKNSFENEIITLLQEYFYNDYGKIGLVLGKGFVREKAITTNDVNTIFADFDTKNEVDIIKSYELIPFAEDEFDFDTAIQTLLA